MSRLQGRPEVTMVHLKKPLRIEKPLLPSLICMFSSSSSSPIAANSRVEGLGFKQKDGLF